VHPGNALGIKIHVGDGTIRVYHRRQVDTATDLVLFVAAVLVMFLVAFVGK
jgi:hypothetical protein